MMRTRSIGFATIATSWTHSTRSNARRRFASVPPTACGARVHPAVEGREVVAETRIVIGDGPDASVAVRYLRGVDLPRLVAMAGAHRQVPDLYEAYQRVGPPVALPDFLGALSVLLGKGVLRNDSP